MNIEQVEKKHCASSISQFYSFFFQKAEAQLAYELQAAKINQKIRNEEIQIQVKKDFKLKGFLVQNTKMQKEINDIECFEYQTHQFL